MSDKPSFGFGNRGGGTFGRGRASGGRGSAFGTGANTTELGGGTSNRGGGFGSGRGGFSNRGGGQNENTGENNKEPPNDSTNNQEEGQQNQNRGFGSRGRGGSSFAGSSSFGGGSGGSSFASRGGGGGSSSFASRGGASSFGTQRGGSSFPSSGGFGRGGGSTGAAFGGGGQAFGNRSENNFTERRPERAETEDRDKSFVPKARPLDEIFEEDLKLKDNYLSIREEDDEVVVTGHNAEEHQQVLDNWNEAGFEELLLENIKRAQYTVPRKIQSRCIPLIIDGHDIKGHAETGSGKSAAFLLPIIDQIMKKKKAGEFTSKRSCPYALIVEPTRELAVQIWDQARKLTDGCDVSVSKTYGKFLRNQNLKEISTLGCDILVGTVGRLVDLFENQLLLFDLLKVFVLDEADQILEDQFNAELRKLTKMPNWPEIEKRQNLLFSATFPPEVQRWAAEWMRPKSLMVSNKKPVAANTRVAQYFVRVKHVEKNNKLLEILRAELEESKEENPQDSKVRPTMVFVKMRRSADVLSTWLNLQGFKTTTINGDRPQELREKSLNEFRRGVHQVVITTDVCARGIDIKILEHVINFDLPPEYTDYVHRIGRTGRVREGTATSFFNPDEDQQLAEKLVDGLKEAHQEVPEWLQMAAEGRLVLDEQAKEDKSWGVDANSAGATAKWAAEATVAAAENVANGSLSDEHDETSTEGTANGHNSPLPVPPPMPPPPPAAENAQNGVVTAEDNEDWE